MEKVEYELIAEEKNIRVDNLFELYRNNPYNARVIFMNANKRDYTTQRLVSFKTKEGFSIVLFKKQFGISKTNRIYSRESRVATINYKNNKFYLIYNKNIRPLTYRNMREAFLFIPEMIEYLQKRFSWLRFIIEKDILINVAFNTIVTKKLYSFKKAVQHTYKVPYPVGKKIHSLYEKSCSNIHYFISMFPKNLEYMENITSLDVDTISKNMDLFNDTLRMAKILNYKVNCKWKFKRLKEVHDEWSEKITDITFIDSDREMKINPLFIKFAQHSNFKMLTTTKEMCLEGKKNNHCVATYVSKVEYGNCAIFHIDGYTLEITKSWNHNGISVSQFRGYRNCNAPKELSNMVDDIVNKFNEKIMHLPAEEYKVEHNNAFDLPF